MLDTIRSWFRRGSTPPSPARLGPESRWTVSVAGDAATVTDHQGQTNSLGFAELGGVAIKTNDSGPWGADLWWLLFTRDGKLALGWPQGATGEGEVIDRLTAMPGFDHQAMIAAMSSITNATFVLWSHGTAI